MSSVWPGAAKLPVILGVVGAVNPIGVLGTDAGAGSKGTSSSILAPEVVIMTRSRLKSRKYFVKTLKTK